MRILIDPAHGGMNLGDASKTGLLEKMATLEAARALQRKLVDAAMTRTVDVDLSHSRRAAMLAEHDLTLSLHFHRSAEPEMPRVEVGAWTEYAEGLGLIILEEMEVRTGEAVKYNRVVHKMTAGPKPGLLIMGGTLNNDAVEQQMIRGTRYEVLAEAVAAAVARYCRG